MKARIDAWGKFAQKIRVPAGTLLGLVFLYFMHPSLRSLWIGCSIALAGGLLRLWAAGHIDKRRVLARSGPYALTRNPLYLGSFVMGIGVLLAGQGYWLLIPFSLLFRRPVLSGNESRGDRNCCRVMAMNSWPMRAAFPCSFRPGGRAAKPRLGSSGLASLRTVSTGPSLS